ncbi:MAG: type II and III secretion system protein family protein [Pseudomonadota bacterium]
MGLTKSLHRFLLAAVFAAPVTLMVGEASAQNASRNYIKVSDGERGSSRRVSLGLDKSLVIDLPRDAHDILVANPDVADAVTRTSRRIYLFGKRIGQTNIFVFDGSGQQMLNLELGVERDIEGLVETIERLIPNSDIDVEMINDNIVLTGTVPTPQASAKAARIAEIFVTGGEQTQTQSQNSAANAAQSNSGLQFVLNESERSSQIVNLLKIEGEDQVHLKVTVAEIQRSIVKQLGIDTDLVANAAGNFRFSQFSDNPFQLGRIGSNQSTDIRAPIGGGTLTSTIKALEQSGVMRTLANPTLTAISGEKAIFRVGGEFPVPDGKDETAPTFDSQTGVQTSPGSVRYRTRNIEYGISLEFTPVVLTPGRISLKIRTEVSEPSAEGSFSIPRAVGPALNIPGIRRRMADTTVELPSGGSMVIAGMVRDDVRQTVSGYPGLAKVPVLGSLFRSREFQRSETELVVMVTPYLVRPVARQKLAQPDDNFGAASDSAGYFMGRVNRVYGAKKGDIPKGRYNGSIGFIFK